MCCADDHGSFWLQLFWGPFWKHWTAMAVTQAGQSLPNLIPPAASATTRGKAAVYRSLLGKTLQLPQSQRWSQDQCALGLLQMGPGIASLWQCWLSLCPPRCLRSAAIASCMDSPGLFHELRHSEDLEGNSLTWLSQVMVGGDYSECCQHLQVFKRIGSGASPEDKDGLDVPSANTVDCERWQWSPPLPSFYVLH